MKLMRYIMILLFIGCYTASVRAQNPGSTPQPPSVIPPSPQAAIFNKYLNHEISDYNGLPQIEIPLYEIEIKGLKIPITLSYHAGGIKYLQYDGDIGAGWSVGAGGYGITRTIRGRDDLSAPFYHEPDFQRFISNRSESIEGYIGYNMALSMDDYDNIFEHCMQTMLTEMNINTRRVDGEYDHFNYSTPGGSGQFIIAGRDNPQTRNIVNTNPENKILTAGTQALSLSDMAVIDGNGFTYYMGKHPTQTAVYEEGPVSTYGNRTGWPLRQIKSPYNETVEFGYVSHNISYDREDIYWDDYYTFNVNEAIYDKSTPGTTEAGYHFDETFAGVYGTAYKTYFISEIRTDREIVEFVRYAPQPETPYVIKEIRIKTLSGTPVKSILFDYSTNTNGVHRLLGKLTVGDQVYRFDYNPLPGPADAANRIYSDVWGYYKVAPSMAPWLNYLDERYKDDEIVYRENAHVGVNRIVRKLKDITEWQSVITWVNRESNGETTHAFSLKKITFPTGGTTEYVYEPNRYKDYYQPGYPIISGAGQRIQKIVSKADGSAKPVTTVFKYGAAENGYADIVHFNWGAAIHNYTDMMHSHTFHTDNIYPYSHFVTGCYRTYSSRRPLRANADMTPPIVYAQVARYRYDETGQQPNLNGKTVSYYTESNEMPYSIAEKYYEGIVHSTTYQYVDHYYLGKRAMPHTVCTFDKDNNLVREEKYTYQGANGYNVAYNGVKSIPRIMIRDESSPHPFFAHPDLTIETNTFDQHRNRVSIARRLPATKTTTTHDGGTPVTVTETFGYNSRNQRTRTTQSNSRSGNRVDEYKYPDSYTEPVYAQMIAANIVLPVVEQVATNNNIETGRTKTTYTATQGMILPDKVQRSASGPTNLRTDITCDLYDAKGNLRQYTTLDGKKTTLIWSYNGAYPVAEIRNATYGSVQAAAQALGLNLDLLPTSNTPDMSKLNALRGRLAGAHVTTYTYKPLVGMTSLTDPTGKTTHYTYDSSGRLTEVYILNGSAKEVLESYKYHYVNQ